MEVHSCVICGLKLSDDDLAAGKAFLTAQKRVICKKCKEDVEASATLVAPAAPIRAKSSATRLPALAPGSPAKQNSDSSSRPSRKPSGVNMLPAERAVSVPAPVPAPVAPTIQDNAQPRTNLNLYFCEKCGKRLTELDIEAGRARNKKWRGVYCSACAVGVDTIEFDAIPDVPAASFVQDARSSKVRRVGSNTNIPAVKHMDLHASRLAAPPKRNHVMYYVASGAGVALLIGAAFFAAKYHGSLRLEARAAEEKKKEDEAVAARLAEEKRNGAEEARLKAEAARLDEDRRRLDEEKRKAEEALKIADALRTSTVQTPGAAEAPALKPAIAVQPEMQNPEIAKAPQPSAELRTPPGTFAAVDAAQKAAEARLNYEERIFGVYALLKNNALKSALAQLDEAKADPNMEPLRAALELDREFATYLEGLDKAVLSGAALQKDGRAFKIEKSDGKDIAVGERTKNTLRDVKNDEISIDFDLGGGSAVARLSLDQLSARTRYELAYLGMPPGPDGELKLAFAGILMLYGGEGAITAAKIRSHLDAARKGQIAPDKIEHLVERLDAFEREAAAEIAIKKMGTLIKDEKWQEANTSIKELTKDFSSTRALSSALPALMEQLKKQLEKLGKPGLLATSYDFGGPLAASLNDGTQIRLGECIVQNINIPSERDLKTLFGRDSNIGIVFSGNIRIPKDGDYIFYLNSDDGSVLYINEKLIVNNDGVHAMAGTGADEKNAVIRLGAGNVPFKVNYFQGGGSGGIIASWAGPDFTKQIISVAAFSHKQPAPGAMPPAAATPLPAKSPPPPDARQLFLSLLGAAEVKTSDGNYGKGTLSDGKTAIAVNKVASPHGLGIVLLGNGNAHLAFKLNKQFRIFAASVALNDSSKVPRSGLIFKVVGDGKVLWFSKPVGHTKLTQDCALNISGVDTLALDIECIGSNEDAAAVWIEPQVGK